MCGTDNCCFVIIPNNPGTKCLLLSAKETTVSCSRESDKALILHPNSVRLVRHDASHALCWSKQHCLCHVNVPTTSTLWYLMFYFYFPQLLFSLKHCSRELRDPEICQKGLDSFSTDCRPYNWFILWFPDSKHSGGAAYIQGNEPFSLIFFQLGYKVFRSL